MKKIRIGSGAGYAGDRIEPAVELMEKGNLDYIIFECLAERTVAIGQQDKEKDPSKGYNQLLDYRMEKILPLMAKNKVKVITNMGAANPVSAAERTCEIARKLGVSGLKIACVTGDDITDELDKYENETVLEDGTLLKEKKDVLISANVYMGAEGITKALEEGADLVITGEGQLDGQTVMGKAPIGVAKLSKEYGKPVLAFSGCVTKDASTCNAAGIDAFFPIMRSVVSLEEAMDVKNAAENMTDTVEQAFRLFLLQ